MPDTFRCKLITPTETLLDEDVKYASVPAWDGLFGIMPGRAPILAELGMGELRIDYPASNAEGGSRSYALHGGFAKMAGNELTILAQNCVPAEQLNSSDADAELAEADARSIPQDAANPETEVAKISAQKEWARLKRRLSERVRQHGV